MKPWLLGNTTVRSPFRLRDGLVALSTSALQGNLRGHDKEMRDLLGEKGIVELGTDETYSVGRKWRSALNKLGFLYPEVPLSFGMQQNDIGPLDMITPNGWRLIRADTVPAMQECFLRALAAYYIPSPLERGLDILVYSPLRLTLAVMLEIEKQTSESRLNFIEMALVVQLSSSDNALADIVSQVLALRARRLASPNKRQFDQKEREATAATITMLHNKKYAESTFNDYADVNLRYLKATGLVQSKGRGLALVPEKHVFVEKLLYPQAIILKKDDPTILASILKDLCNGAMLPTDDKDSALVILDDLLQQLNKRGIPFDINGKPLTNAADIANVRHEIEAILSKQIEEEYAAKQAGEWEEIADYMNLLIHRTKAKKKLTTGDDIENEIVIPQAEAPAYFEWVLWRAFLAINSLKNKPYESRRFKIDQDFLPVGTAPGNGPDLIFEFDDFVLVVEVTLTTNSRQEAAEGEPVRRHVANIAESYAPKKVFGLFIANKVDTNTVETLRIGFWYKPDDSKTSLQIIPMTLEQFERLFRAGFSTGKLNSVMIREILRDCLAYSNHDAPAWKTEIERTVQEKVISFN